MPDLICPECGEDEEIECDDAGNCQCQRCWCAGTVDDFAIIDDIEE